MTEENSAQVVRLVEFAPEEADVVARLLEKRIARLLAKKQSTIEDMIMVRTFRSLQWKLRAGCA